MRAGTSTPTRPRERLRNRTRLSDRRRRRERRSPRRPARSRRREATGAAWLTESQAAELRGQVEAERQQRNRIDEAERDGERQRRVHGLADDEQPDRDEREREHASPLIRHRPDALRVERHTDE